MSAGNGSTRLLRLGSSWSVALAAQPETGMGYQVASVRLNDGRVFENVTIVGGTISAPPGTDQLPFGEADIAEIIVTHGKPGPWRQRG